MLSRLAQIRKAQDNEEYEPEMPLVEAAGHVLDYLFEIGPTMLLGMGEAPLTHVELAAWQANTGVELSSWESRTLLRLSREYMTQGHKATKPDCAPPWTAGSAEARRAVAINMRKSITELSNL